MAAKKIRVMTCSSCGGNLPPGARACTHCGVPLHRRAGKVLRTQIAIALLVLIAGLLVVGFDRTGRWVTRGSYVLFAGAAWLVITLILIGWRRGAH